MSRVSMKYLGSVLISGARSLPKQPTMVALMLSASIAMSDHMLVAADELL